MGCILYSIKNFDKIAITIGIFISSILTLSLIAQVVGLVRMSTLPSVECHINRLQCLSIPNDRYVCNIRYYISNVTITDLTNVRWDTPSEQNTTCYILKDKYVLDVYYNTYGIIEDIKGIVGTLVIVVILTVVIGIIPFFIKRYMSQSWIGYLV